MDELERQLAAFVRESPLQRLDDPFPEPVAIQLWVKRDDLLHPLVSGNKWRKLKYNLLTARSQGLTTLLTFGGAYSNHLYSTAAAGRVFGFQTIGVVRGEEYQQRDTPTLACCRENGMRLYFVSRAEYRELTEQKQLRAGVAEADVASLYILPEGGTNHLAVRGAAEVIPEIITQLGQQPSYVCCSVGTGGTAAGLVSSAPDDTVVLGFSALKGGAFLQKEVERLLGQPAPNFRLQTDYHFGGYAKITPELLAFMRAFEQRTGVQLEQVYTGKMLYGIYDLARKGYFLDDATVVAVHTGGLQGRSSVLNS